jgi:hypothetical protein
MCPVGQQLIPHPLDELLDYRPLVTMLVPHESQGLSKSMTSLTKEQLYW